MNQREYVDAMSVKYIKDTPIKENMAISQAKSFNKEELVVSVSSKPREQRQARKERAGSQRLKHTN